jgi:hypothetical protein
MESQSYLHRDRLLLHVCAEFGPIVHDQPMQAESSPHASAKVWQEGRSVSTFHESSSDVRTVCAEQHPSITTSL